MRSLGLELIVLVTSWACAARREKSFSKVGQFLSASRRKFSEIISSHLSCNENCLAYRGQDVEFFEYLATLNKLDPPIENLVGLRFESLRRGRRRRLFGSFLNFSPLCFFPPPTRFSIIR